MSTLPGNTDLTIYQGDLFTFSFTLQTWTNYPTKPMVLTPEDLTGKKVRFQVRQNTLSDIVILEGSTDTGEITVTPLTGLVEGSIDGSVTAELDFDCAVWDIELYTDDDDPETFLYGKINLIPQVSRPDPPPPGP